MAAKTLKKSVLLTDSEVQTFSRRGRKPIYKKYTIYYTIYYKYTHSLRWPIYVFNLVVNTKLPATLSHRRSTTVSLETYPLY